MRYFSISIKTQFENVGDALINRLLITEASKYGTVIVDVSRCPISFIEMLNLESMPTVIVTKRFSTFILYMLKLKITGQSVTYFLNPGGLGKKIPKAKLPFALAQNFYLLFLRLFLIKIAHLGFSISNQKGIDKWIFKIRSYLCSSVHPRDSITLNYMKDEFFKVDSCIPDLAFLLNGNFELNENSKSVLFSFRTDSEYTSSIDFIKLVMYSVYKKHGDVKYYFSSQVLRDESFNNELFNWFSENISSNAEVIKCKYDIDFYKEIYRTVSSVYSNRLHVLLLAWSSGCSCFPCIPKGTGTKIRAIYRDLGLEKLVIDETSLEHFSHIPFSNDTFELFTSNGCKLKSFFSERL